MGGMDIPINLWLSYRNSFKSAYGEIADERNIHFMKFFLEDVWGVGYLNQPDRIHPTAEWYDIIVENLYQFLLSKDILKK
jgi:acyl-CoA thioesterase-1